MSKEWHDRHECGCGGMCMWINKSNEEKIKMLEEKQEKFKKMIAHLDDVKKSVSAGKPMKKYEDKDEDEDEDDDEEDEKGKD